MSKIEKAFEMLMLLQSKGRMRIEDIANELQIKERTVRSYRDEFEEAHIYIDSKSGKYGGYKLENSNFMRSINLTKDEYASFLMGCEYLKNSDFIYSKEYKNAENKIKSAINKKDNSYNGTTYFVKEIKSNYDLERERKKWFDINAAIATENKIKMKYFSLSSGLNERTVRPYAGFEYNGALYFIAYCEKRNRIIEFKISRIQEYQILKDKFEIPKDFSLKEYMRNSIGIFGGEEMDVKLKVKYPFSRIISEKIWVENQKIINNEDDDSIIFEAKIKGINEIKSWILSMGKYVEVIKPEKLKNAVLQEIKEIKNNYE